MDRARENWAEVVDQVLEGDRTAFLKLSRLITGYLTHWRAFDFQADWEDMVQDTVTAAIEGIQRNRIRNPAAVVGYVRTVARSKFTDRLRRHLRWKENEACPWEEALADPALGAALERDSAEFAAEIRIALAKLPDVQARIVLGVHGFGRTYEQVAKDTGVPLGSLKRYLRQGLSRLRQEFSEDLENG